MSAPTSRDSDSERALDEMAQRVADGLSLSTTELATSRVARNLGRLVALRAVFGAELAEQRAQAAADDPAPTTWGHLRVLGRLGAGGFGVVYNAFDPVLQREVALKLRRVDRADDADALAHIDEARRMARVRHPHVLAIHGAGMYDGRAGIWADRLDGETVQQRLHRLGPLPRTQVLMFAMQLAGAIEAIHATGLVHGDIKASNVMLEGERATLMDFGAALPAGAQPRYGSPAYMAPETLAGAPASAAGDMYAFGALLYRMAVGDEHARDDTARVARLLRRALGRPLARLIADLLAENPAQRPLARDVMERLETVARLPQRRVRRVAAIVTLAGLSVGLVFSLLALRAVDAQRNRTRAAKDVLVESALSAVPRRQSAPSSLRTLFDKLAELAPQRLVDYPEAQAELLLVSGRGLYDLGENQRGLELAEQGLRLVDGVTDYSMRQRADALALIGMMRRTAGDLAGAQSALDEASALYEAALQGAERALALARTRSSLANLLSSRGDWLGAEHALTSVLEGRAALPDVDDASRAADHYNLGLVQLKLNHCAQAREHLKHAMALLAQSGMGESLRAAFVLHGAAQAENCLGNPEQGLAFVAQARAVYVRDYASDHPYFARLASVQANAMRLQGKLGAALQMLDDAQNAKSETPTETWLLRARLFGELAQWQQASVAIAQAQKALVPAEAPLGPYARAAQAWYGYRAGQLEVRDARAVLDAESAQMRRTGYSGLREYTELQAWRNSLEAVVQ